MITVRLARFIDRGFWFSIDNHMSQEVFEEKVCNDEAYVVTDDGEPIGLMRYGLFWDNIPFCNLLYILEKHRHSGCGTKTMVKWEKDMKSLGYDTVLVSTQSDEDAQHFYRKLGYEDCGEIKFDGQPKEIIMSKKIS